MKIAVIGMGIAGMAAAHLLAEEHEIVAFEANDYVGGHTNTIPVAWEGQTYPVDTGFIVFNEETYPNFVTLLKRLGISWQPTNMSFSVQNAATGLEYGFRNLHGLFAQRRNLYRRQAPLAQHRWPEINGVNRTYFCGAYWGCGFREDGVVSALRVCRDFGKSL